MQDKPTGFGMIGNVDLSNVMRGRSFPVERREKLLEHGLPWVPANVLLSPCNSLPAGNPFGPVGETKLVAADTSPLRFLAESGLPEMSLHLAEIQTHEGAPWPVCPRTCLRDALDTLRSEFGLSMKVGFEHEFYISGLEGPPSPAFSLEGSRRVSDLSDAVHRVLSTAGAQLEQFAAEFGHYQFEIAGTVTDALQSVDNAVLALAAIRDLARRRGLHATFAPKPSPDQPGSGVHIHFSLWEGNTPVTAARDALTPRAAAFAAGILAHLPSVLACSISNANSYLRLTPSSWVGIYPCMGTRNREAAMRLCPRKPDNEQINPGASVEYRLADTTANPYLALAALIHSGMDGLRAGLGAPVDIQVDPETLPPGERDKLGLTPLPKGPIETLAAATALEGWFGPVFGAAFRSVRENDIADAERLGDDYIRTLMLTI